jgi:hypothetical protein
MKKIESLTPEQEQQMIEFREEWRAIGLQSGPVDVDRVRPTINDFYDRIGKSAPYIWRCESPLTAQLIMNLISNLGANLGANLGDNLWANLGANLRDNLWANLWDNLWDNLWANLGANLRDNLWANLWDNLWDNLGDNLRDNLRDNLGDNLWANLWDNLWANLWDNLRDNLGDNLWANLGDNLGDNLRDNLSKIKYFGTNMWGNLDSYWIAYYVFPNEYLMKMYADENIKILNGWVEISKSCGWWYPFENICFVCDRPVTRWDSQHRLHGDGLPAFEFADGWKEYYWHGIHIPERAAIDINSYTAKEILSEKNAEVRRALMNLYGFEKILPEVNAKIIDQHPDPTIGKLYEFELDGQKYHVAIVQDGTPMYNDKKGKPTYRTYAIGTRTSLNDIVSSLKDTYPLYRDLTNEQYLELPRT